MAQPAATLQPLDNNGYIFGHLGCFFSVCSLVIFWHRFWTSFLGIILMGGMPDRHREPDRNEEIMVMGAGTMGQI